VTTARELTARRCRPCEGKNVRPLGPAAARSLLEAVPGWELSTDSKILRKLFSMEDFKAAVQFIQKMARIAEKEDHHPDIHLTGYRKLTVELSTHAIGGLSENDFIMAAKIEALPKELKNARKNP
jgi:4a-hydroxytetrahydrobiopterin dehydratase